MWANEQKFSWKNLKNFVSSGISLQVKTSEVHAVSQQHNACVTIKISLIKIIINQLRVKSFASHCFMMCRICVSS